MDNESEEPKPPVVVYNTVRHDGWTGEKMAIFCETLAETAIVAEACEQAGMSVSGAYAARRRNPIFAAAWDAALGIARERLADTLLARSMEGNVEQVFRDGELVGERHFLDNRLGLQILRRLDRLAEATSVRPERSRGAPSREPQPIDWSFAVEALRTGDDDGVAHALALLKSPALSASNGNEVEEVEGDPNRQLCDGEDEDGLDLTGRCWKDEIEQAWMTDFPPPSGFAGHESRDYDEIDDEEPYVRACTEEEVAILEADAAVARAAERAEDEELRDRWFEILRNEAGQA